MKKITKSTLLIVNNFLLLISTAFLFNLTTTTAQTELFTYANIDELEISQEDRLTIDVLANSSKTEEYTIVLINEFIADNRVSLRVQLPHVNGIYNFESTHYRQFEQDFLSHKRYSQWQGTISSDFGSGNFILLKDDKGGVGGLIDVDGRVK